MILLASQEWYTNGEKMMTKEKVRGMHNDLV